MRMAVMLLVVGIVLVMSVRRPFWGTLAILASYMIWPIVLEETWGYFYWWHIPQALYLAALVGVAVNGRYMSRMIPRNAMDYGMLGFLLVMVISCLLNGVDVFENDRVDYFFKCTVLYFLLSRTADTPRKLALSVLCTGFCVAYLAYTAWWKYRAGLITPALPSWSTPVHEFGLQLVLGVPLLGVMIGRRLWLPVRVALLGSVVLCVLVAMRTESRSTYLGVGLGLLMLAWFHRRHVLLLLLALPLVAFAVMHNPADVLQRLESIWTHQLPTGEEDRSIQSRYEQVDTALRIISSDPLLGIGPRQFLMRYLDWVPEEEKHGEGRYTMHSVPLLILCEEGITGFIMYYGLMALGCLLAARRMLRRARDNPELQPVAVAGTAGALGFISFLGYGIGQPAMWHISIYACVAIVSACEEYVARSVAAEDETTEVEFGRVALAAPGGAQTEVVFPFHLPQSPKE